MGNDKTKTNTDEAAPTECALLCAEQLLSILTMDMGYKDMPKHGHTPLRHQIAWDVATGLIGDDESKILVRTAFEIVDSGIEKTLRPIDLSEGHRKIVQMAGRIKELEMQLRLLVDNDSINDRSIEKEVTVMLGT